MDRALFTGGPAYLVWNGITFQMHEDWTVDLDLKHFDVKTNLQGTVGKAISDSAVAKIKCKPIAFAGSLAALLAALVPYQPSMRGTLIFPSSDLPLVIQTQEGKSITFAAAALTQMPELTFAPDKEFFGTVEFTCLIANETAPDDAAAFFTLADSAYVEPSMDPLDILFDLYTLVWGATPSAPFDGIETDEAGITFTPKVTFKERRTASRRLYNFMIDDVTAEVKFVPENVTETNWAALIKTQGTGYGPGKLRGSFADVLTIAGSATGKARLTIPLAAGEAAPLRFSADSRVGQVTMSAHRKQISTALTTTTTSTSKTISPSSTAALVVGMLVSGTGIPANTTLTTIVDGTHALISKNATASGSASLTYKNPLFALDVVP